MTDKEKIIKGIAAHIDPHIPCESCPYWCNWKSGCFSMLLRDILKMVADQPKWIPVEEKLPEDSSDCLVYNGSQVQFCSYYCGTWNTPDCYESETIDGVTHWMPLPKPPEGESE